MALTALEEAFKKSGLVSAAEIDAREQRRLDDLKEAKQHKEKERQQQNEAASKEEAGYPDMLVRRLLGKINISEV
jgi:hypothetical protein